MLMDIIYKRWSVVLFVWSLSYHNKHFKRLRVYECRSECTSPLNLSYIGVCDLFVTIVVTIILCRFYFSLREGVHFS